jgi:FixJ family two-component response regulator
MLTGHADESDMADLSREVGLEAFIRKPWNAEQLFSVVESAVAVSASDGVGARP